MLDLTIHGKNLEITPSIQEHVTTKLGSVDRHLPCISRAEVEVISEPTRSQKDRVVVQVTLTVPGSLLRTQQRAANTKAAINLGSQSPGPSNNALQGAGLSQRAGGQGSAGL